ncbi:alpha-L-glutamate ligase [Amylibacter ulvae]|uniref:Alpha-L-glutamate ligase n=1 Tax=Paramylibacter ulvae TaxID=1651968 RepID=A0ABQ3CUR4_9RHOB|nr:30S ribosomal protein S6--L-glutamate ligase [Amylibacter ulvae]GHA42834.1 alpha-L-glutamate ligase [Amylibacter ulvae]
MAHGENQHDELALGWEEWLALPDLGLPALKAKIDTGARTSALHAFNIEPFGTASKPRVRFVIQPIPGRDDLEVICSADVIDRRDVTSSNGESELRYVVRTNMQIGDHKRPIEITLTDRANMAYRMLLGRQALGDDIVVNPSESFIQPKLSYDLYKSSQRPAAAKRPLRIAILTREPDNYSTGRLIEEGERRDHVVETIDTSRCYMNIRTLAPEIHYDGKKLPHYDAVIPRIGASITAYGTAVVRQFETIGTYCVNGSEAITASRDKLYAHQLLARYKIGMPTTAFASSPKDTKNLVTLAGSTPLIVKLLESTQGKGVVLAETPKAAESVISAFRGLKADFLVQHFVKEAAGEDVRCMVIGGKVVSSIKRTAAAGEFRSNLHQGGTAAKVKITKEERETAVRAAKAMGLNFAGVDLLRSHDGPKVLEVNSSPGLEGMEKASKLNVAGKVYDHIEKSVRPAAPRRKS